VVTREDVLAHELDQACHAIEFLHGCLTNPIYSYEYPEQTLDGLRRWRWLARNAPQCSATTARHDGPCAVHNEAFLLLLAEMEAGS